MSVPSNRRDFLTGRAVQRSVARAGDELADVLLNSAGEQEPRAYDTVRLETRAMACPWSVILEPGPPDQLMRAADALPVVHELEARLSVYRDDSDISRINRLAADSPQPLDDSVFDLLSRSVEYWRQTGGAFDVAGRAQILLWKRCREQGRIPGDDEIAAALESSGSQHVRLNAADRTIAFDRPGIGLDLGAIGKGYAVDQAAASLLASGLTDFVIHGGFSSVFARGTHGGQGGWPIGLKNPLFTEERYATLLLRDQALATSGSNIQYFRYQGKRYGHLLDPRTGWPADSLLSVSVLAPTAAEADALSTAFYVMGLEKAVEWCHNRPEIGALLVPPPITGRELAPVLCNIPPEILFVRQSNHEQASSSSTPADH
ncbi:MAG: FAD:protein FMN transferase [Planctomycetaceae bacterium]|nr:FAD:protein FMN transferase [Planctomycetaceae bacterium]